VMQYILDNNVKWELIYPFFKSELCDDDNMMVLLKSKKFGNLVGKHREYILVNFKNINFGILKCINENHNESLMSNHGWFEAYVYYNNWKSMLTDVKCLFTKCVIDAIKSEINVHYMYMCAILGNSPEAIIPYLDSGKWGLGFCFTEIMIERDNIDPRIMNIMYDKYCSDCVQCTICHQIVVGEDTTSNILLKFVSKYIMTYKHDIEEIYVTYLKNKISEISVELNDKIIIDAISQRNLWRHVPIFKIIKTFDDYIPILEKRLIDISGTTELLQYFETEYNSLSTQQINDIWNILVSNCHMENIINTCNFVEMYGNIVNHLDNKVRTAVECELYDKIKVKYCADIEAILLTKGITVSGITCELGKRKQRENDKWVCKICITHDVNMVYNTCGHVVCDTCVGKMSDKNKCPFCRNISDGPIVIFTS